ncbi:MAG: NAD(P)/FAD-dependent oxidoreductase, partial [Anaerolineales bacterium]
ARYDWIRRMVRAAAVRPQIEGVDLEGVVYLDSLAQTDCMIKRARRKKKAVVIGGGITAIEIVEGLIARGVAVDFFIRGERYWNRVLDEIESRMIEARLQHDGVRIHKHTEADRIIGKKGQVAGVVTKDGRIHNTRMVAFSIGVTPRIGLAKRSGLDTGRGIRVNEYLESSAVDIFAAGDVAETFDPVSESWMVDSLWSPARYQGHVAGLNMAGQRQGYRRRSALNVTRLTGLTTTIIGRVGTSGKDDDEEFSIVRGESESWQQLPNAIVCQNNFDVNRLRIMVGDTRLAGALLMGDQSLSSALEDLVREEVDITRIRESLVTPGADLGSILFNHWQRWRQSNAN